MTVCGDVSFGWNREDGGAGGGGGCHVEGGPGVPAGAANVAVPEEVRLEALFGDAGGAEVE